MIIKNREVPEQNGRKGYDISGKQQLLHHVAVRVTTPDNPFKPHRHEAEEIWYVVDGEGLISLDGQEHAVEGGDLVILEPRVEHGLRAAERVKWICLG